MTKKAIEAKSVEATETSKPVTVVAQKKELTIRILMQWQLFTPDPRQYKPSAPVLVPAGLFVGIDVPLTSEFVMNASEIIQAQISSGNGKVPDPILTPIGMRYCIDQVESAMTNPDRGKAHTETFENTAGKAFKDATPEKTDEKWEDDDSGWTDETTSASKDAPEGKEDKPVDWTDDDSWNEN